MTEMLLLDPVQVLEGPGHSVEIGGAALFRDGRLEALGEQARAAGKSGGIIGQNAAHQLLAPCLVDVHSFLPDPFQGQAETLNSLVRTAGSGGFGQIALLPDGRSRRERPDQLHGFQLQDCDVDVHLWAGFSQGGNGEQLTPHADLIDAGAIGLSDGAAIPSMALIDRALTLGECGAAPVLISPLDLSLRGEGLLREGPEALRAGWPGDPLSSETVPLSQLVQLQQEHPQRRMLVMGVSTQAGVALLQRQPKRPGATVSWWHLLQSSSESAASATSWFVSPSLGNDDDRQGLIDGLLNGVIDAVAVNALPLDDEECLLPPDQRQRGVAGHQQVLPALWQALVLTRGWSPEQLWSILSFKPSTLLGVKPEQLCIGSNRWLLFDPDLKWTPSRDDPSASKAANQPLLHQPVTGKVVACGLRTPENRCD